MNQVEILTELICDRIIKKISNTSEDELLKTKWAEQSSPDQINYINLNEKEFNEIYRRVIYLIATETEADFRDFFSDTWEVLHERFTKLIARDIKDYYKNKEIGKPWLKQNAYLNEFETFDDFLADDNNVEAYEDLLDEVEENYPTFKNNREGEYKFLIILINQTVKEFEDHIETRSKQLEMSEEEYVRFIYMKYLRKWKGKS